MHLLGLFPRSYGHDVCLMVYVDRHAWECAVLTSMRDEIKSGNLSVKGGKRYSQFNDFFIPYNEWEKIRTDFFKRASYRKILKKFQSI